MLFYKNFLTNIISTVKSFGSAVLAGLLASASIALILYLFMMGEELISWIMKIYVK